MLNSTVKKHLHRWFESQGAVRSAERISRHGDRWRHAVTGALAQTHASRDSEGLSPKQSPQVPRRAFYAPGIGIGSSTRGETSGDETLSAAVEETDTRTYSRKKASPPYCPPPTDSDDENQEAVGLIHARDRSSPKNEYAGIVGPTSNEYTGIVGPASHRLSDSSSVAQPTHRLSDFSSTIEALEHIPLTNDGSSSPLPEGIRKMSLV